MKKIVDFFSGRNILGEVISIESIIGVSTSGQPSPIGAINDENPHA